MRHDALKHHKLHFVFVLDVGARDRRGIKVPLPTCSPSHLQLLSLRFSPFLALLHPSVPHYAFRPLLHVTSDCRCRATKHHQEKATKANNKKSIFVPMWIVQRMKPYRWGTLLDVSFGFFGLSIPLRGWSNYDEKSSNRSQARNWSLIGISFRASSALNVMRKSAFLLFPNPRQQQIELAVETTV